MSKEIDALLHFIFLLTAVFCYFLNKAGNKDRSLEFVGGFLIATLIVDAFGASIMFNRRLADFFGNNLFLYHILLPVQFTLIMLMYRYKFNNVRIKKLITAIIPIYIITSVTFSFTIQPYYDYNTYAILLKHVIVIFVVLLLLFEMLQYPEFSIIYKQPVFWINTAFLFHAVANIFLEGLSNYLFSNDSSSFQLINMLYSISNYVLFIFITIGLSINRFNRATKTATL